MTTTVSLLTAQTRGAIATIVVQGQQAITFVESCFTSHTQRKVSEQPLGKILFGTWNTGEELVVALPASQRVEIHCHGGFAATSAIIDSLEMLGAEKVTAQQWLQSTTQDYLTYEAQTALIATTTERTALMVLAQSNDRFKNHLSELEQLIHNKQAAVTASHVRQWLSWSNFGLHLTQPWRVMLAGEPNVGKSCLMNRLIGYERSIVYNAPGTTRDILTAQTAIDGWPITLCDTAGLRSTHDKLESLGVAHTEQELRSADLILWVTDATHPATLAIPENLAERSLHVINKIDLLPNACNSNGNAPSCYVSAMTGAGIAELLTKIADKLVPTVPEETQIVPLTQRQIDLLHELLEAIQSQAYDQASVTIAQLKYGAVRDEN